MNKMVITIGVIILVLGFGWYLTAQYNTDDDAMEKDDSTEVLTTNTSASPVNDDGNLEVVDYAISMNEYSFTPSDIMVEGPGETLKIRLTNDGDFPHNFIIDELDINSGLVQPGDSTVISLTAGQIANEYEIYCGVGNHRSLGMLGLYRQ